MTIKDLARESGYSLGTVSRVLNNQPNVSDKARRAILAIAEANGFELNQSAQLLKQQRSNTVLIIVKGTSNEMFARMVEQLQSLFSRTTHPLIVDFIDEDENEVLRGVRLCRERKPAGVMFLGGTNQNFLSDFGKIDIPAVVVTNDASTLPFENLSSVSTNDRRGAACAVEYLIRSGHREIAVLGGDRKLSDTSEQRYIGCVEAFARNQLRFDEKTGLTQFMREKESEADYRYFPEPDLPPVLLSGEELRRLSETMPALPEERRTNYLQADVSSADADRLLTEPAFALQFEEAARLCGSPKDTAALMASVLSPGNAVGAERIASVVSLLHAGTIHLSTAKKLLLRLTKQDFDPALAVETEQLSQLSDRSLLEDYVREVLEAEPGILQSYRNGKKGALSAVIGKAMAKTNGRGNPAVLSEIAAELLAKNAGL